MVQKDEDNESIGGLRIRSDDPAFRETELVECGRCSRSNPPNRPECIYCGAPFDKGQIRADAINLSMKRPEPWEDGFSIVIRKQDIGSAVDSAAACSLLGLENEDFDRLIASDAVVPICYLRSKTEAEVAAERLVEIGLPCSIIGDDLLMVDAPPTRLRGIDLAAEFIQLRAFNSKQTTRIGQGENVLLVSGSLTQHQMETSERRKRRKSTRTEEIHSFSDEAVLDIYPQSDVLGFRIRAAGFDFSCLGADMRQLTAANMTLLRERLKNHLPRSIVMDEYASVRPAIDAVWPLHGVRGTSSVNRRAFGGVGVSQKMFSDNVSQFTRFSRLQRHFV